MNKILVIGESCTDVFYYGSCDRLSPEAPVPILNIDSVERNGGMAMNVVENIRGLGIECEVITNPNRKSLCKERYVHYQTNHMFLRVDNDSSQYKRCDQLSSINFSAFSLVVISDYNKGFLLEEDIEYICSSHPCVFLDTKKHLGAWCDKAYIIKINFSEFTVTQSSLTPSLEEKLIVTMGHKGSRYRDQVFPAEEVEVKDVSGAGDTFLAGLVVKYCDKHDLYAAIQFATECATLAVQQRGVSTV